MWAKRPIVFGIALTVAGCRPRSEPSSLDRLSSALVATDAPVAVEERAYVPATQPGRQVDIPVVADLAEHEAALLEASLRRRIGRGDRDATVFISLGAIGTGWKDPPPEFLQRFADLPCRVRPVSAARLPHKGEMESPMRFRAVEDPESGKPSPIYWAEVKRWVSDTNARVDGGIWYGPLGGGGSVDIFSMRPDGTWAYGGSEGAGWRS